MAAIRAWTLSGHGALALSTATIAGLIGQAGSVTVSQDGGYGALSGKAVALEPATGFTFVAAALEAALTAHL